MDKIGNKKIRGAKSKAPEASTTQLAQPEPTKPIEPKISDFGWKGIQNEFVFCKEPQSAKALNTANRFASEPKEDLTVFPSPDEPDQKVYWGGINGFFFAVVVGVSARVPKSIAAHIRNSRIANLRTGKNIIVVNPFTGQRVNVDLSAATEEHKRRLGLV